MKPTSRDDELDKLLVELGFHKYDGHNWGFGGAGLGKMEKEKSALNLYINQEMLKARIDELEKLPKAELDTPFKHMSGRYRNHARFTIQYVAKRLNELRQSVNNRGAE